MNGSIRKQTSRENEPVTSVIRQKAKQPELTEPGIDTKVKTVIDSANLIPTESDNRDNKKQIQNRKQMNTNDSVEPRGIMPSIGKTSEFATNDYALSKEKDAEKFQKYLNSSGVSLGFQIIFGEIIQKKVPKDKVFAYAHKRLKQLAADIQELKNGRM